MPSVHPVRFPSVSDIRAGREPRFNEPKAGSRLREVYDLFVNHPGEIVEITLGYDHVIEPLRNYWGLDVRRIYNGSIRVGRGSYYALVAYWNGKEYVECPMDEALLEQALLHKKTMPADRSTRARLTDSDRAALAHQLRIRR